MVYSLFRTVWPQIAFPATGCVQIGTSGTGVLRQGLWPVEIGGSHPPKPDNRRRLTPAPAAARLRGSVDLIVQRAVGLFHILRKASAMDRAEFEADLRREGYELREGEIKPNVHRGSHAHEFDARLFVLEGSITLVFGADRCTYRPGDACNVPAGTMHEEHTEAGGVRYLAGRRPAAQNVTAAE